MIHLVGSAARQADSLKAVLENEQIVYWGILPEARLIRLIEEVDIGIVPHTVTEVSKYMNPLKVEMYVSYGLPVVCTEIPGLAGHDGVQVCATHEDFKAAVETLARHAEGCGSRISPPRRRNAKDSTSSSSSSVSGRCGGPKMSVDRRGETGRGAGPRVARNALELAISVGYRR